MNDIFDFINQEELVLLKQGEPKWVSPMLATLTKERFSNSDWIFECKFDGVRALIIKNDKEIKIFSRNNLNMNQFYPELVKECSKQKIKQFIIDGEIIALKNELSNFSLLQQRMHSYPTREQIKRNPVFLYVFDIIYFNGYYLEDLPLLKRKGLLKKVIDFKDTIRYTEHIVKDGLDFYQSACNKKWEGIIAKYAYSKYVHERSTNWLKFKCVQKQEFVIGGFTAPRGNREGFGALLLGYYVGKDLQYAGKVGTGYTHQMLMKLSTQLKKLKTKNSPFAHPINETNITWISPQIVAEVSFSEWTKYGKLRHPSFDGLRIDKSPIEVVREIPE